MSPLDLLRRAALNALHRHEVRRAFMLLQEPEAERFVKTVLLDRLGRAVSAHLLPGTALWLRHPLWTPSGVSMTVQHVRLARAPNPYERNVFMVTLTSLRDLTGRFTAGELLSLLLADEVADGRLPRPESWGSKPGALAATAAVG